MTCPKCFPNKQQRPGRALASLCVWSGKRYCKHPAPSLAGSTTPKGAQSAQEETNISLKVRTAPRRTAGRRLARPRVFTYPGRQQAVITVAEGWQGMKKRPRSVVEGPQRGRCRDEVWRYGCGEKPIQNPYGHEKTGHFTAPQDTIRNERE